MSLCAGAATTLSPRYYLLMPYCGNRKLLGHCCSTLQRNCSESPEVFQRKMEAYATPGLPSYCSGQLSHQLHLADWEPDLWIIVLGDMSLSSFQNRLIFSWPSSLPLFPEAHHLFPALTICLLYPYVSVDPCHSSPRLCLFTWSVLKIKVHLYRCFSMWNFMPFLKRCHGVFSAFGVSY